MATARSAVCALLLARGAAAYDYDNDDDDGPNLKVLMVLALVAFVLFQVVFRKRKQKCGVKGPAALKAPKAATGSATRSQPGTKEPSPSPDTTFDTRPARAPAAGSSCDLPGSAYPTPTAPIRGESMYAPQAPSAPPMPSHLVSRTEKKAVYEE
eukprot:TRINITY_DN8631_c0_g4_i2.p1 TRINITY_DN8631_c0_g4~~TRINITY_DN8631_c0_g4_i2.p1  ORF type:complete len:173 (+),score=44.96 TRINITY_DN8631_c0_g4_i2:58-519(+)